MTRKIIDTPSLPDAVATSVRSTYPTPDLSLDEIGNRIITILAQAVQHLSHKILEGDVSRETVGALKDCQGMVRDLKKDEKDYIDKLSDKELEEMLRK